MTGRNYIITGEIIMIYYVSANAAGCSYGTAANPFHTITEAARIAQPGDEVIVAPGIYREYVNPLHGGTDDAHRITYRSETPLGAVITGAEEIKDWTNCGGTVWSARIPNRLFGDYNPYTTLISGDWFRSPTPQHTGEVYLNGKSMYERPSLDAVKEPVKALSSWDPDFTVYTWYTCQDGDCTVIYANFQEKDPNQETVEINVRRNCFYPDRTGIGYITLSGFCIRQAATDWAPPTGYQEGMVGPHWSKGWIIDVWGSLWANTFSLRTTTNGRPGTVRTVLRTNAISSASLSTRVGPRRQWALTSFADAISMTAARRGSPDIWAGYFPPLRRTTSITLTTSTN